MAIAVAGVLGIIGPGEVRARETAPDAQPVGVQIRDEGFVPPTLHVGRGTVVVFENRGAKPHWPASNIHPTHHIYPEFDAKRALEPGERWVFRFDRAGQWGFHDHLTPELAGRIVVTETGQWLPADAMTRAWRGVIELARDGWDATVLGAGRLYYRVFPRELETTLARLNVRRIATDDRVLRYWVGLAGPERLVARLLEGSGGGRAFDCHQEAHQIGRAAYTHLGGAVFRRGDSSCHAGFYHGAMEAFVAERGTANLAAEIDRLCGSFDTRFGAFQCYHGVGHGVMANEAYDLPRALHTCGGLATRVAQGACYEGAFMENVVSALGFGAQRGHRSLWLSRDPHFPCNALGRDDRVQFHCYQMQTSWMLALYDYDFARVARECQDLPGALPRVCYRSLGRDIAGIARLAPATMAALCAGLPRPADAFDPCLIGALDVVVDFWGGQLRDQASELCRLAPEASKLRCYAALGERLGELFVHDADRDVVCRSFEPSYRRLCERG
jgi:hypothetical protein